MLSFRVTVVVVPDGDGYHAFCPAFKGLHMDGSTVEEVLERTCEGLDVYLRSLARHGDPVPVGPNCEVEGDDPRSRFVVPSIPPQSILRNVEVPCPVIA